MALNNDYSIKLDVLRALVAERHVRILAQMDAEEAKPKPEAARIVALDEERFALPTWDTYPDADRIDVAIDEWKTLIEDQRRSGQQS